LLRVRVSAAPSDAIMLILMTVMIVRDIIVRRWGSLPTSSDVIRRLP
jgi:hypothetical protein